MFCFSRWFLVLWLDLLKFIEWRGFLWHSDVFTVFFWSDRKQSDLWIKNCSELHLLSPITWWGEQAVGAFWGLEGEKKPLMSLWPEYSRAMASAGLTAPRGSCFQQWLILGGKILRAGQVCSGASREYFSGPAVLAVRIPASGVSVTCSSQQLACCHIDVCLLQQGFLQFTCSLFWRATV